MRLRALNDVPTETGASIAGVTEVAEDVGHEQLDQSVESGAGSVRAQNAEHTGDVAAKENEDEMPDVSMEFESPRPSQPPAADKNKPVPRARVPKKSGHHGPPKKLHNRPLALSGCHWRIARPMALAPCRGRHRWGGRLIDLAIEP